MFLYKCSVYLRVYLITISTNIQIIIYYVLFNVIKQNNTFQNIYSIIELTEIIFKAIFTLYNEMDANVRVQLINDDKF